MRPRRAARVLALNMADNERTRSAILALEAVVDKLERILAEETAILQGGGAVSDGRFIVQKSQILQEFNALQHSLADQRVYSAMKMRLQAIRVMAERNHALLTLQAEALVQLVEKVASVSKN